MNVMVTGGAGYIGSITCKLLYENGFSPIVFDNYSTGHREFVKWGEAFEGDLSNKKDIIKFFEKFNIESVIHFAGSAYVGESMTNPFKYYRNNLINSINLLEVMNEFLINKIIFSSSCATYGNPKKTPINENCYQNPINPYGKSKLFIEQVLKDLSKSNKLTYVALRYFNACGADKSMDVGEFHIPETHLIPLIIRAALHNEEFNIYGTDYETKDGTAIRDYTHVTDLAKAHVLALKYLSNGGVSQEINLGTGKGVSVKEVISAVEKLGHTFPIKEDVKRRGDPAILFADRTKAKKILGWTPEYDDINEIIKTAIDWHKSRLETLKKN